MRELMTKEEAKAGTILTPLQCHHHKSHPIVLMCYQFQTMNRGDVCVWACVHVCVCLVRCRILRNEYRLPFTL